MPSNAPPKTTAPAETPAEPGHGLSPKLRRLLEQNGPILTHEEIEANLLRSIDAA